MVDTQLLELIRANNQMPRTTVRKMLKEKGYTDTAIAQAEAIFDARELRRISTGRRIFSRRNIVLAASAVAVVAGLLLLQ